METILVLDVPAEKGGALTILKYYYKQSLEDKEKNWIFVTSTPILEETKHIKNIRYPWIKKSWFHRLYFDNIIAPSICKKNKIDRIFSLQNIAVPRTSIPQTLYVHQSLPFSDYKFTIKESKILWVYQNIIGRLIYRSMKKSDKIIVQTHWMKKVSVEKLRINPAKISVERPKINIEVNQKYRDSDTSRRTFFYPSSADLYKNHAVVIEALLELKNQTKNDYRVIFTIEGNENSHVKKLYNICKVNNLPVQFIGKIESEKVMKYYSQSILLFPSYIETLGLPLLEAKLHDTPIIVSDTDFAHEVLYDYDNVVFFEKDDFQLLANTIREFVE